MFLTWVGVEELKWFAVRRVAFREAENEPRHCLVDFTAPSFLAVTIVAGTLDGPALQLHGPGANGSQSHSSLSATSLTASCTARNVELLFGLMHL